MKNSIIYPGFILMIVLFAGCGEDSSSTETNLAENIKVSDCGGFESGVVTKLPSEDGEEIMDCSQLIVWEYDDSTEIIKISIKNIELNCAGIGKVQIRKTETNYEYIISEDLGGGDAGCSCLFDFSAELAGIISESLDFKVSHSVKYTETETTPVWDGTIDLSQKSGEITIKERLGDQCSELLN